MLRGSNLIVSMDGTPVACSTGCDLQMDRDFLEVCSPTDGAWLQYVPTTLGWNVSSDGLLADMEAVRALQARMVEGKVLTLRFYDSEFRVMYKGDAYLKSLSFSGQVGSMAKYSTSLQGSGALEVDSDGRRLETGGTSALLGGYQMALYNKSCYFYHDSVNPDGKYLKVYSLKLPRCRVIAHSADVSLGMTMTRVHAALFREHADAIIRFIKEAPPIDSDVRLYKYGPIVHSSDSYDERVEILNDLIIPAGEYTLVVAGYASSGELPYLQIFS